jgi:hypothetical protein
MRGVRMSKILPAIVGSIAALLIIVLNLSFYAIGTFIICRIIYFFLAMAGIVPPIDIIPVI